MTENQTDTAAAAGNGAAPDDGQTVDVAALVAERDALLDQLQRARADYANLRRRSEQEFERAREAAVERVLRELLPVLDDLQDGLAKIQIDETNRSIVEGMRLVEQKFLSSLKRLGVVPVEALGQPFDHTLHDAVDHDVAGGNTVAAVYRPGYRLGDELLRPAMVKVGPASPPA
ncbi:MAG: nucleotide exchange factor GrpE [Thermomicrobiales bacterium]|nr:nucleotide exchange factor GrpE [Thermomicrobiales bacterium]